MELSEFLDYVDAHLDPRSDDSVVALTPQLQALGSNKRFVARFLAEHLDRADFQQDNAYADSAMVLARRPTYTVRVVGWPPAEMHFYANADPDPIAHTHSFSLLTYGYLGPGYNTEIYSCDPDELARCAVGDPVTIGPVQRATLTEGSTLFFPAFRVAHVQQTPREYSVSLNLMVHQPNPRGFEQYFISPLRRVLTGIGGTQTEGAESILRLASRLPRTKTRAALAHIAATHALPTIRQCAAAIVDELEVTR